MAATQLAADHPDLVTLETYGAVVRGPRPAARHGDRFVDRRARHEAGALGRRQHPRRRADGHGRRVPPAAAPRRRLRRRRRHGRRRRLAHPHLLRRARGSTPTAPSGCSPTADAAAGRACARGRAPTPTGGPGSHVEDIDGDGRILQMRIPDPDGAWMPHPDDARLLVAVPPDGSAPPARALPAAQRGHGRATTTGSPIPTPRPPEGLDMNRNFPAGWGTERARVGRPSAVRTRDRRPRPGDRRPAEHLRVQRLPHERRRAAAAVVDAGRLDAAARWTSGSWKQLGERGTALTGYTVALGLRGLHVGQDRHDERRRRRLGVRAPRRVRVDHRVLGHRPRRDRHEAVDPLLVPRPDRPRRRSPCCGGSTAAERPIRRPASSTGTRSITRSSDRSSSVAGTTSARGRTRPATCCAPRWRRTPSSPSFQALASPCLEIVHTAVTAPGRRHVAGRGRHRQHGLAADPRDGAGAQATTASARSSPNSSPATADAADVSIARRPARQDDRPARRRCRRQVRARSRRHTRPALVSWVVRAAAGTELTAIVRHDRAGQRLGGHPRSSDVSRDRRTRRGSMQRWMT